MPRTTTDRISAALELDMRKLADALRVGDICLDDGSTLADMGLSERDIERLAQRVTSWLTENRLLTAYIASLSSMKWLNSTQACIYAHKSLNKLKDLTAKGLIYGTKGEGSGDWIFERASIDRYYYRDMVIDRDYVTSLGGRAHGA